MGEEDCEEGHGQQDEEGRLLLRCPTIKAAPCLWTEVPAPMRLLICRGGWTIASFVAMLPLARSRASAKPVGNVALYFLLSGPWRSIRASNVPGHDKGQCYTRAN